MPRMPEKREVTRCPWRIRLPKRVVRAKLSSKCNGFRSCEISPNCLSSSSVNRLLSWYVSPISRILFFWLPLPLLLVVLLLLKTLQVNIKKIK